MKDSFGTIVIIVLFIVFVALVIVGQRTIDRNYLFIQLLGLLGILGVLWKYNRKYT